MKNKTSKFYLCNIFLTLKIYNQCKIIGSCLLTAPPDLHHDDESWFVQALHSLLDLNPYFKSNKLVKNELVEPDEISLPSRRGCNRGRKQSACEMFHKQFSETMERADAKNQAVVNVIEEHFSRMNIAILKEMRKTDPSAAKKRMASFPAIEKCRNRKRLAPPSSPSKIKKRRN